MNEAREFRDYNCLVFSSAWHITISSSFPLQGTATSRLVLRQRCVFIFAGKQQRQCNGCVVVVQWRRCKVARMQWWCNGCVVVVANSNGGELQ
ncbi:hypothetical protein ACFX1T_043648 [Malus domestica]